MSNESSLMSKRQMLIIGVYLILLNLLLLVALVKIWPGTMEMTADDKADLLWGGWLVISLPPETRYLLIAAVAGALGSYIHLATSFGDYAGNRRLSRSWAWWYLLRPLIGMALAVIFYFVLRGGLVASNSQATALSPFGVAAIAGLAGMFSKQATDKLREVFENLFRTEKPPDRADKLQG